ncbi:MAG: hypothetical protein AB1758_10215 [Candidatus Eremiobacterota bacterium]
MVIRESPPCVHLSRPLRAAASQPAAPADTAQLSGAAAPVSTPWAKFESAGVMVAGGAVSGPIGAAIGEAGRQELQQAVERLQSAGVKLEYRRRLPIWKIRPRFKELTAEQAVNEIAAKKPDGLDRLEITVPGQTRRPLESLSDLHFADGLHAAGRSVLSKEDQAALRALDGLESKGFTVQDNRYYYDDDRRPVDDLQVLRWLHRGDRVDLKRKDESALSAYGRDGLLALEYFQGSGQDHGLKDSAKAARIRQAAEAGIQFYSDRRESSPFQTYVETPQTLQVGMGKGCLLNVKASELEDVDALKGRLAEYDQTFREILAGPYEKMGWTGNQTFPSAVLDTADKFGLRVSAAVFGELVRSAAKAGDDRYDAYDRIKGLYADLCASSRTPFELARKASLVASTYATAGQKAAREILGQTREAVETRTSDKERRIELEELFFTLLNATGSVGCATEGLDLVRIRVGNESQDERVKVFRDIAARQSERTLDQTAACYRAVLVERAPGEGVAEAGARFVRILDALAVGRNQDRAIELFSTVQQGIRDGAWDGRRADQLVDQFARNLVLTEDVDKALNSLFASEGASQGAVAERGDVVIIGGVRVPRK